MDFWQERASVVLAIWIFIAPWVLGFTHLTVASWDHWIVGVLVFLISLSVLNRTLRPVNGMYRGNAGPGREL